MSNIGYATLSVIPSFKGFGSKLSDGIAPEMTRAGKEGGQRFGAGLSSSASGLGSKAGKILGVGVLSTFTLAIAGIGAIMKTGFDEAMDASKGTAQLAAGIKSTGGAAGVSVKNLNDLASSIQGYSGQTDDSIVASEQLLLTFTNIKNSKSGDIFDAATQATADMAAKMGGDASGAAIQLGKALNDPVKGISALSRVGVSFSDAQKQSIKTMQEHGDMAGAQSVILKELQTEFGGAALAAGKSLPGQMAIAKRSFEDLSQSVVTGIMPALSAGLSGLNGFVQGVKSSFEQGGLSQVFTDLGAKITAALPGIQASLAQMGVALWVWIQAAVPPMLVKLGELLVQLGTWIGTVALPAIGAKLVEWGKAFVEWITPMIPPALAKLGDLLVQIGNWLLTTALPAIGAKLLQWGKAFVAWIGPMIPPVLLALGGLLLKLGGWLLGTALPAIVGKLGEWALAFAKWVPGAIVSLLAALIPLLGKLGGWILSTALPAIIIQLAKWAAAFIGWVATAIVELPGKLVGLLGAILSWASGLPGKIVSALGNLGSLLFNAGKSIVQGLIDGIGKMASAVGHALLGLLPGPLQQFANLLGIKSPSTVFAGFGANIGQGLIDGIDGSRSGVEASMAGLVSLPTGGSMDFASSSSIASAVSGSGSGAADRQPIVLMVDRQVIARIVVDVNNDNLRRNGASALR